MITNYTILILLTLNTLGASHNTNTNSNNLTFNFFLSALAKVESNNNPKSYNLKENAIGIYQIRELYFIDAQRFNPALKKYNHKDCFDPEVSRLVVTAYLSHYESMSVSVNDWGSLAKCHNGGLNWRKKTGQAKINLDKYWLKVKNHL